MSAEPLEVSREGGRLRGVLWRPSSTAGRVPLVLIVPGSVAIDRDGRSVWACFNERLIRSGADLAGEPLDTEGGRALDAMQAIVEEPALRVEFTIERGQVQYIDNRHFAHSRTDFTDADDPRLKRHMIRLWTRQEGRRTFHA